MSSNHKPQPGVRDSEGRKIPKKYLRGLSEKKRKQMKKEIKDFRDRPDDDSEAYEPWEADEGVKPKKKSKATKAYHRMFGKTEESVQEDEARNGKWDITHKDISHGRIMLKQHSTGKHKLLRQGASHVVRRKIANIERAWDEGAGPRHMFPNRHKHIDAVLEPYFEESPLEESWKKKLGAFAVGAACLAGSGCASQAGRAGSADRAGRQQQDAGDSIRRETDERLRRMRAQVSDQQRALGQFSREAPAVNARLRRIKPVNMPGESEVDRERSVRRFHRQLRGEAVEVLGEESEKGLAGKAKASGIPVSILRQVFKRGMAAWKTGHRPGVAQQQWAYGRVNSFITGSGGARKADADLWARAKKSQQEEAVILVRTPLLAEDVCDTKKVGKPWRTPGGPKKFAVCDTDGSGDKKLVRFGSSTMEIKRDDPGRRKNFRARHRCDSDPPADATPRKWACKTWQAGKSVGAIVN